MFQSVRVRASDLAAQCRAKSIRDAAVAHGPLGDPSTLEKSALFEFLTRPPLRPRGRIAIHDTTDAAAILGRVLAEDVAERANRERGRKSAALL